MKKIPVTIPVLIPVSFVPHSIANMAMRRTKTNVAIHGVAQAAGVSVSTVSRVLNNKVRE